MVGRVPLLRFALGLCVLALAAPLQAEIAPEKLIVLVRIEESVPARWHEQALRAAQHAAQANARYTWLPPPQLSLDDSRTALGCTAWDPRCVATIGKTLAAHHVLYVEVVRPFQQRPVLTMFSVRVEGPDDARSHRVELPDAAENGGRVLESYLRAVLSDRVPDLMVVDDGRHLAGQIAVAATAPHAGTQVTLDGQLAGEVPLVLPHGLATGTHRFVFEKDGYARQQLDVTVVEGRPLFLAVDLLPGVTAEVNEPTSDGRGWLDWLGWGGLGIGAIALAASGGLYTATLGIERRLVDAAAEGQEKGSVTSLSQVQYQDAVAIADGLYLGSLGTLAAGLLLAGAGSALLILTPGPTTEPAAE